MKRNRTFEINDGNPQMALIDIDSMADDAFIKGLDTGTKEISKDRIVKSLKMLIYLKLLLLCKYIMKFYICRTM